MIRRTYQKKPVRVQAAQVDTSDYDGMCEIIAWVNDNGGSARATDDDGGVMYIDTLEGPMLARPGDFIIQGVAGEFYPCKPDIFAQSYDEVS